MKNKKLIIAVCSLFVVALSVVITVVVINNHKSKSIVKNDTSELQTTNQTQSDLTTTTQDNTSTTEQTTEEVPNVSIEWTEFSYETEDNDGYTYLITVKLSPWILYSETDIINEAWSVVGKDHSLPTFDSWGFKKMKTNIGNRIHPEPQDSMQDLGRMQ